MKLKKSGLKSGKDELEKNQSETAKAESNKAERNRRGKFRTGRIIITIILILILYIAGTAVSIWRYGKNDEKQKADVAIVLGAAAYGEKVSPVFKERLNHGIWLYENGYVDKLIATGGMGAGNEHSDAYAGKKYLMEQGVPEEDILIEEESTVTQENLENAKEFMDEYSYSSAIIVSDPLHMKRSMLMAKDCGIKACSSPTPTTRYVTLKSKIPFLVREEFFYIGYKACRIFDW